VTLPAAPPHTYAFVFCVMCQERCDFSACETSQVHLFAAGQALALPFALGQLGKSTFATIGVARRVGGGGGDGPWAFEFLVRGFPARNFMDVYADILELVAIDRVMAAELRKQQPVFQLRKGDAMSVPIGLTKVRFGLGWDSRCDVDSSCIGLTADGHHEFSVYFGSRNWEGIVVHSGDNTTGEGSGDDEQITVDLQRMPMRIASLFFTVNVFTSGKDFTDVAGEYCRLVDMERETALLRFKSLDSAGANNGVVLVALHRTPELPQQWTFSAVAYPAEGRTCSALVDECQMLQRQPPLSVRISLRRGENLTAMDWGGTSDPYVIIKRSGNEVFRTRTVKNSLNPTWDADFTTTLSSNGESFRFKVMDADVTIDDTIGKADLVLRYVDIKDQPPKEYALQVLKDGAAQGTLHITVGAA
jgi:stress response protein SCP2